jgi:group I intron endonuclease
MNKDFYTYLHCKPNGDPFYVGKGYKSRAYEFKNNRNTHYLRTIKKYGKENILIYIFECISESQALNDEIQQISQLKQDGYELVNLTDGGEGCSGLKHSEETKQKISKAKIGVSLPTKGRPLSKTHKLKLSMAKLGKSSGRKGKKNSEESKLKVSIAKKGVPLSEITCKRMSIYRTGRKQVLVQCPNCGKSGGDRNMKRYHFNNCKTLVIANV